MSKKFHKFILVIGFIFVTKKYVFDIYYCIEYMTKYFLFVLFGLAAQVEGTDITFIVPNRLRYLL